MIFGLYVLLPARNATSSHYTLSDGGPILNTRLGKWDSTRVSNPAALIYPNGSVLLAYRGNGKGRGGVGVAIAPHWKGPYTHLYDEPLCESTGAAALFVFSVQHVARMIFNQFERIDVGCL